MRATLLRKLTVTHCSLFCPFPLDLGAADLKNLIPFRLLREAVRIWTLQFLLHQSNSVHPWGAQVTWINWVPCQVSFKQFNLGTRDSCKFLLQNREWHQHIAWTMPCHGKYRGFFKLPWSCHLCREWKLPKSGGSPADLLLTANGMICQDSYDDSHYIYIYTSNCFVCWYSFSTLTNSMVGIHSYPCETCSARLERQGDTRSWDQRNPPKACWQMQQHREQSTPTQTTN